MINSLNDNLLEFISYPRAYTQSAFTCSKATMETAEQYVKLVQVNDNGTTDQCHN